MIKAKRLILVGVLVFALTSVLFPYISSQVRGIVRDKETGEVISNVEVYLYDYKDKPWFADLSKHTKTNDKGLFVIDDVIKGTYFFECIKEGYATFSPEYFTQSSEPNKYLSIFSIEEGQVKFLEVQMERGGKLKVTINKKDENGVSGYKGIEVGLYAVVENMQSDKNNYCTVFNRQLTDEHGQLIIDGLHPGRIYGVRIDIEEFPKFREEILIKRNETVEVTHLYDYSNPTGITGNITFSDKPLLHSEILLVNFSKMKRITTLDITRRSKYIFRNLEAGNYMMYVYVIYDNEEGTRKDISIVVEINKTTTKDLQL